MSWSLFQVIVISTSDGDSALTITIDPRFILIVFHDTPVA